MKNFLSQLNDIEYNEAISNQLDTTSLILTSESEVALVSTGPVGDIASDEEILNAEKELFGEEGHHG